MGLLDKAASKTSTQTYELSNVLKDNRSPTPLKKKRNRGISFTNSFGFLHSLCVV